ncbi:hypothetical protein [Mucilaginibacter auburnensis]|nr:hypothetical protein [Mucilaginibacter auburnensis]
MNKLLMMLLCTVINTAAFGQGRSDSAAYEMQRKKINSMLNERSAKFGQYDASLSQHTGIFGLQTKKDIRRSNEILMDIVRTDNEIYRQLKILLDYRAFQQTQVQQKAKQVENSQLGFLYSIKKLQDEVAKLRSANEKQAKETERANRNFYIAAALIVLFVVWLLRTAMKNRNKKLAERTITVN